MADKHTPGPWRAIPGPIEGHFTVIGENLGKGAPIIVSTRWMLPYGVCEHVNPHNEANVALAATAPELLDDLREAWNLVMFLTTHLQGRMGEGALADMEAKADGWAETILKATGGT